MIEVLAMSQDNEEEWDAFVERSPQGTVFAKSFWLRGFERLAPGNEARAIVVRDGGGSIQAGLPLFVSRSGRRLSAEQPTLTNYISLLFAPRERKDENREAEWEIGTTGEIIAEIQRARYESVCLAHVPGLTDVREFIWQGWTVTPLFRRITPRISARRRGPAIPSPWPMLACRGSIRSW